MSEAPLIEARVRCVIDADNYLGETPVWSAQEQALYWTNVENPPCLSRWDFATGTRRDWPMPERLGGFVLTPSKQHALVVLSSGIYLLDFTTGALAQQLRSPLPDYISLHECQCDRDGRLWVGAINHNLRQSPQLPGGGNLFRLAGDQLVAEVGDITCANGLAFSPSGDRLYLTDSPLRTVHHWSLDRHTGRLSGRVPFFEVAAGAGFVDGATVDTEGCYWAALVYGAAIRRYGPDGTLRAEYRLPFGNPTKVAFGGPAMQTLFITTCKLVPRDGMPVVGTPLLGGVYAMETDATGIPDTLFSG